MLQIMYMSIRRGQGLPDWIYPVRATCLALDSVAVRPVVRPFLPIGYVLPQAGIPDNYPLTTTHAVVLARRLGVWLLARACATAPPPLERGRGEEQGVRNGTIIYIIIYTCR